MHIRVVGGGISGLAAAWELSADPDLDVEVIEAGPRLGGKIYTSEFRGRPIDEGPDAFLRRVPFALDLCAEVGLDGLVSPATGSAFVWSEGALRRLPSGLVLGVPTDFDALAASAILSERGAARAMAEPSRDSTPLRGDIAIGELITNHYGPEVTERLVGPLLGGINAGDVNHMSLDAVAPQLAAAAHASGSLTRALRQSVAKPAAPTPVFAAPVGGMGVLIEHLAAALSHRGVRLRTGSPVDRLDETPTIVAIDAQASARMIEPWSPEAAAVMASLEFASVVFTTLSFDADSFAHPLDGSGFLVPRDAGLDITAASWSSTKWAHLSSDEEIIVRVSMGHSRDHDAIERSDEEVLERITADLTTTMGAHRAPTAHRITRYPLGFPQYTPGHLGRTDALEAQLEIDAPHLAVCGMAHRGVGIPACIREARAAARALVQRCRPATSS